MEARATLLIVDDEPYNLLMLEQALGADFALRTARDGIEALAVLQSQGPADLILSDIVMPNMGGFDLCRRLKADPAMKHIPLLFLSGLDSVASEEEGLLLGAADFIHKPFSPPSVLARVRTHLKLSQATRQLREQYQRLEAVNRELEGFCYSISHDLRAPLRALDGYARILAEDCADRLSREEQHMLDRIRANAQRMGDMIDDLLELSRAASAPLAMQVVDLSRLAGEIVATLHETEPQRNVRVTIEPGLEAAGDPAQLRIVLENLLGNALKYTGGADPAEIRFYAQHEGGGREFCVTDNGAGFDMAHAKRLFQPFQRLHGQGEFPGTGVGLATVARILSRHGGRIRAEARPGEGATFRFFLPGRGDRPRATTDNNRELAS
jgi:signal transduction histidine kinase